ncbi:hypothetical protein SELMODRAFT_419518 [Selaginella moellendorffii]|uniref:Uncharacterized protein n=1 Tax=Selaginella moellendorffii TaxID=88036 RepID=D8S973_SELML|nr:hypothetical protein SELMODRAFT_419518 [Selaginella moellendorffii]
MANDHQVQALGAALWISALDLDLIQRWSKVLLLSLNEKEEMRSGRGTRRRCPERQGCVLEDATTVSWTVMLEAYAQNGDANMVSHRMPRRDVVWWTSFCARADLARVGLVPGRLAGARLGERDNDLLFAVDEYDVYDVRYGVARARAGIDVLACWIGDARANRLSCEDLPRREPQLGPKHWGTSYEQACLTRRTHGKSRNNSFISFVCEQMAGWERLLLQQWLSHLVRCHHCAYLGTYTTFHMIRRSSSLLRIPTEDILPTCHLHCRYTIETESSSPAEATETNLPMDRQSNATRKEELDMISCEFGFWVWKSILPKYHFLNVMAMACVSWDLN